MLFSTRFTNQKHGSFFLCKNGDNYNYFMRMLWRLIKNFCPGLHSESGTWYCRFSINISYYFIPLTIGINSQLTGVNVKIQKTRKGIWEYLWRKWIRKKLTWAQILFSPSVLTKYLNLQIVGMSQHPWIRGKSKGIWFMKCSRNKVNPKRSLADCL